MHFSRMIRKVLDRILGPGETSNSANSFGLLLLTHDMSRAEHLNLCDSSETLFALGFGVYFHGNLVHLSVNDVTAEGETKVEHRDAYCFVSVSVSVTTPNGIEDSKVIELELKIAVLI